MIKNEQCIKALQQEIIEEAKEATRKRLTQFVKSGYCAKVVTGLIEQGLNNINDEAVVLCMPRNVPVVER